MKEVLIFTLVAIGVLGVLAGFFILVGIPIMLVEKASCNRVESNGTNTEYRLIGGCYVEVNGRLIPKENWRGEYETAK